VLRLFGRRNDDKSETKVARATKQLMSDMAHIEAQQLIIKLATDDPENSDYAWLQSWAADYLACHAPVLDDAVKRVQGDS
jgi:hypothetical protein